jgi:LPXTG-site transpeptidase (sortase) family protein
LFLIINNLGKCHIKKNDYIRLLIPNINFDKFIYYLDDEINDVDYNVELLSSSDIYKNIFYFAGHSGSGDNCYFNRIVELNIGDYIYIYLDDIIFVYEIVDIYEIVKNGYMAIESNEVDVLYLITCKVYNNSRQLVVKSKLI